MLQPPDFTRDRRGWFYRALAADAECAVLEVGDAFAGNWFSNVVRGELVTASENAAIGYDIVLLHETLGGCATLDDAIASAHRLLRHGGMLVVAGENWFRMDGRPRASSTHPPRATGFGFRASMSRAGFADVALYTVHPDASAPVHVVRANRLSSHDFFRAALGPRRRPRWSPRRLLLAALTELNLMPYIQPHFVVVGTRC